MTRFVALTTLAALLPILMFSCQSAEDRQAAELREFLRREITKFNPLNQQVIAEKQKLYEIDSTSPFADVDETRERHSNELADLRQRVEEYPDLELTSLANEIRTLIMTRQQEAESVARSRRQKESFDRIQKMYERTAARDREAWKPKIIGGGETKTVD